MTRWRSVMPGVANTIDDLAEVSANLTGVNERIALAARQAGRTPESVTLVAVSKTHSPRRIEAALRAGHRCFGENRVQEALTKWPALRAGYPDLRLHLIGPLQTNKVKEAVQLFDVIESVDRPKLASALAEQMTRLGRRLQCFVQVNTGDEPQKAGVPPKDADEFIRACRESHGLPVIGLMCIPPLDEPPALHFALLREIARRHALPELSMGMSADFEEAIRFGATYVRVGTAVFGSRPPA